MNYIKVYNESTLFERIQIGDLLQASNYSIIFIKQGSMQLEVNDTPITYEKQHIVLITPKNIYKIKGYSSDLQMYFMIYIREIIKKKINLNFSRYDVYHLINFEKNNNMLKPDPTYFAKAIEQVEHLEYHLKRQNKRNSFQELIITSLFATIIYLMMDCLYSKIESKHKINTRKEDLAMQYIELVNLHYIREKNLEFYASKLCISIKYLSICVKEITGFPASFIIANAVMKEAKTELLSTSKTISTIAIQLGFSDQYSFGKFFKKQNGISPRGFRNKNKTIFIDTI